MRTLILAALAAALLPTPLFAAGEGSEPAAKGMLICQEFPRIGSRLEPRRYCLTRKEWDLVAIESRRVLGEFVQRSTTGSLAVNSGKK